MFVLTIKILLIVSLFFEEVSTRGTLVLCPAGGHSFQQLYDLMCTGGDRKKRNKHGIFLMFSFSFIDFLQQ